VRLTGEVSEGQQWRGLIGQGWEVRLTPIPASGRGYTGWDIAVNPEADEGYPDALLLATPPYGSLTQREIGTTFGLRAQDSIAWSPRRFHFLISAKDLRLARKLFAELMPAPTAPKGAGGAGASPVRAGERVEGTKPAEVSAQSRLLALLSHSSTVGSGEFSVTNARFVPGSADAAAFAQQWAAHLGRVPHTVEQSVSQATARGELHWIHFEVTLWLPGTWKLSPNLRSEAANCAE
jgi:hypothetical protein